jgi:uncharacterized membrane protein YuzA (DUF378 family)
MKSLGVLGWIAVILLIIGGLNIGFAGVFGFNILGGIFGNVPALLRVIYVLIGLSALWGIYLLAKR